MAETKYKLMAPLGSIIVPKEVMTEGELRIFAMQIAQEQPWIEKAEKDPMPMVLQWLRDSGYSVTEV